MSCLFETNIIIHIMKIYFAGDEGTGAESRNYHVYGLPAMEYPGMLKVAQLCTVNGICNNKNFYKHSFTLRQSYSLMIFYLIHFLT